MERRQKHSMINNITQNPKDNSKKKSSKDKKEPSPKINISEPKSSQDLCEAVKQISIQPTWNKSLAERFTAIILNPKRQYQLDNMQKQMLTKCVLGCPSEYRALIHFSLLSKNFTSINGLRTLDGITDEIVGFIQSELDLEPRINSVLLNNQGNQVLFKWLKDKLADKEETLAQKLDFIRNLISYLICKADFPVVSTRIDIVLSAFADGSLLDNQLENTSLLDKIVKDRVKAITDLFTLEKPTTNEAKRLTLFGVYSQALAIQKMDEVDQLDKSYQREKKIRLETEQEVSRLKTYCQKLEDELIKHKKDLIEEQENLEHQKKLYAYLKSSSELEISQQKNAVLNQVQNRLEHELDKLERCFINPENLQANARIALKIIGTIKSELAIYEDNK